MPETLSRYRCILLGHSEEMIQVALNSLNGARIISSTTFWVPNKRALLDMLALAGFKPIEGSTQTSEEPKSYRICMICKPI